jgi:hypothetical protein
MTNAFILDTPVSEDRREQLEALAKRRGYANAADYLLALAESDAQAHGENLLLDEDDTVDVEERLRQALTDVKEGRVYPYDKLREMLDDDSAED